MDTFLKSRAASISSMTYSGVGCGTGRGFARNPPGQTLLHTEGDTLLGGQTHLQPNSMPTGKYLEVVKCEHESE
jgi:hypothetical protein